MICKDNIKKKKDKRERTQGLKEWNWLREGGRMEREKEREREGGGGRVKRQDVGGREKETEYKVCITDEIQSSIQTEARN